MIALMRKLLAYADNNIGAIAINSMNTMRYHFNQFSLHAANIEDLNLQHMVEFHGEKYHWFFNCNE